MLGLKLSHVSGRGPRCLTRTFMCIQMFQMFHVKCHPSHWRQNERDCVPNHQYIDCLLNRLFRCKSKETSKLRVTGLCDGNTLVIDGFPSQRDSNAKKGLPFDDVIIIVMRSIQSWYYAKRLDNWTFTIQWDKFAGFSSTRPLLFLSSVTSIL